MSKRGSAASQRVAPTGRAVRPSPGRWLGFAQAAALLVMTGLAYWPAVRCGFIWDDDYYVQNNLALRSVEGLRRIWLDVHTTPQYYPLVHTSYWVEYQLWGLSPAGYHVVNICLHALGAILAWRVLKYLQIPEAWAAAAIFALHPAQVESVAWITERKNVLSGVLYFGAALAYLHFALPASTERQRGWYVAALVLFIGALLSKTVTCSLPAALLLVFWWKGKRIGGRELLGVAPFFGLGLAFGLLTAWLEKHQVRAAGEAWDLSIVERILVAGRALWFYGGKLVWPARLAFIYPRWQLDARAGWQYAYPAAALAAMIVLWLSRARLGRGPLVAVLFFAGTLVPALGFFDVFPMRYSFVADHFQYIACLGLITLGVTTVCYTACWLGRFASRATAVVGVVILAILGTLTWQQQQGYLSLETLWRATLRNNPDCWLAHNNLVGVLREQGKVDEAIEHCREALRLEPRYAEAHWNMALLLTAQGDTEAAIGHYNRALEIEPDYARAHSNLAGLLNAQGRVDEAVEHCRQALRVQPNYTDAHCNLAIALAAQGNVQQAAMHYREAVRLQPDLGPACNNLAWLLATHPDAPAHDVREAVGLAEHAADLTRHEDPAILDTLAAAYASAGQYQRAVATAQKAQALAVASGANRLAEAIATRIELYRQGKAYRQPTATQPASRP